MNASTAAAAQQIVREILISKSLRVEDDGGPRRKFLRAFGANRNGVVVLTRGKRSGAWQGSIDDPEYDPSPGSEFYWVFVDLGAEPPNCYVCPGSYVAADISRAHAKYLEHHGGERAVSNDSKHHAVSLHRVEGWKDMWQPLLYQANLSPERAGSW